MSEFVTLNVKFGYLCSGIVVSLEPEPNDDLVQLCTET